MDIKEHGIEECSTAPDPQIPGRNIMGGSPRRLSTRDPRTTDVSLASPISLYRRAGTPMAHLHNIVQSRTDKLFQSSSNNEVTLPSDGEDKLVIVVKDE